MLMSKNRVKAGKTISYITTIVSVMGFITHIILGNYYKALRSLCLVVMGLVLISYWKREIE